jgi:curved DNA-binding protein CbpA
MTEKDYYKILGVSSSATEEEIKEAFFRLAKKYHPDKHRGKDASEYETKFAQINEAYNLLKDRAAKVEYDIRFRGTGRQKKHSPKGKYKAEELYHAALKALKMNDVNSAIDLLKAAVRLEPAKAEYYSLLGRALSGKPRRLHEAREMCEKAVEMEPYDVDNYINLGLVYKKAGLQVRARKQFEKALRWDPSHFVARQELGVSDSAEWFLRFKAFVKKILGT